MIYRLLVVAVALNCAGLALAEGDRDAQPIKPPVPSYPLEAAARGTQGLCQVRFNVNKDGLPFNLDVSCTSPEFCSESKRAVSRVTFAPKIVDGERQIREDVVYPLEYRLATWSEEQQDYVSQAGFPDGAPLEACEQRAVS